MTALPILEQGRACGDCTACCTHLDVDDPGIAHAAHVDCQRLGPWGCSDYEERPSTCREFICLWLTGFDDETARPDRSGFIGRFMTVNGEKWVALNATRAGALDDGSPGFDVARTIGCQLPTVLVHFDGTRQFLVPMAKQMPAIESKPADA